MAYRRISRVSETPAVEQILSEGELRYKEVFENFSECIFLLDVTPDGRFKFAGLNPAEERAVGLSSDEVYGKFVEDVLPDDVAKQVIAHYRGCLETGKLINYEDELQLPAGPRHFHTNLIPVRNGDGRIHRIVGCCIDITDLKRAQAEALARHKLESLGVLAAGIAHDFNNLLGSILVDAELALMDLDVDATAAEEIQRIRSVALRASEIVRELMIYARQETARFEPLDLSSMVDEMLHLLRFSITKHAVIKTDLAKNLPAIQANAAQIRQVLMNLITNASEAIAERHGVIHVTTGVATLPAGEYVRLVVSDTGSGMTKETQARIFEPFFTTKFAGRGMGMAVVEGIVRSHGGAIHLESMPGQGTSVQIFFPASSQPAKQDTGAAVSDSSTLVSDAAGTVLLVEDEDALRFSISKALRGRGFSVTEARDGSAAIDLLGRYAASFDVILLDITIPGASSLDVIAEARRVRPDIKVILTSAYNRETAMPPFDMPQVKGFIRKPFHLAELVRLLQETLSS